MGRPAFGVIVKRPKPWAPLAVAAVATLALAVGFGGIIDHLVSATAPAPQLRTVPAATLAGLGLKLGPASAAPYCGLQQGVAARGWLPPGSMGCPISRSAAQVAAVGSMRAEAQESVLATVSSGPPQLLRGRLAWVVVVRQDSPPFPGLMPVTCAPPTPLAGRFIVVPCPIRAMLAPADLVVVVDAHSAQRLALFPVMSRSGLWVPLPPMPGVDRGLPD